MNWELIGKLGGGSEIQVHPVEVIFPEHGVLTDREVLKVRGEPGVQYLVTIVGHYENDQSLYDQQLRWRTESSGWVQNDERARKGQTQVAVLAQDGDTLTVGRDRPNEFNAASFIGKAYVAPAPEISEETGNTTTFPFGPMTVSGTGNAEHLVADIEVPPGEVWKVKVTANFTPSGWISNNYYPTLMIGPKETTPRDTGSNNTVELEAYVSTVSRISIITRDRTAVEVEGTVEITPMKW